VDHAGKSQELGLGGRQVEKMMRKTVDE